MKTTIKSFGPEILTSKVKDKICELAAHGFGRENNDAMKADTLAHIAGAERVQLAYHFGQLIGFALYGRSLWRECY